MRPPKGNDHTLPRPSSPGLVTSPETAVLAYFMNCFIITSPFEGYLPSLCQGGSLDEHDAFSSATRAAAFATFALRVRDHRYLGTARSNYALSLAKTNAALTSQEDAVLDKTLAAVLLLGLFEALVFQGPRSGESWTAHTMGAAELLRLRGPGQFRSKTSHQLFVQTLTNIRTSCVQRGLPVPSEIITLAAEAKEWIDPRDPTFRLGPIIDRAASIRARAETCPGSEFALEAWNLDREITLLTKSLDQTLHFGIAYEEEASPWSYLGIAYRYPSHRAAKYWNAVRMIRMFVNNLIWDSASLGLKDTGHSHGIDKETTGDPLCNCALFESLQAEAADNMEMLATDVLGSVPEFLERAEAGKIFRPSARTLVWPLYLIQQFSLCSLTAKTRATAYLYEIANDLNIPYVAQVAQMCELPGFEDTK